jgi:hypothetical protein
MSATALVLLLKPTGRLEKKVKKLTELLILMQAEAAPIRRWVLLRLLRDASSKARTR